MKTTIEMSDELFRKVKATAALRGQTMKELVTEALHKEVGKQSKKAKATKKISNEKFWQEWEALAGQISKEWKGKVDAVETIREQRR